MALGNGEKGNKLKKGVAGTMPVFLVVPKCCWRSTSYPTTATKSVKEQNLNQVNLKI